eukprot:5967831-Pyramimonas_sp.AAC.1
MNYVRTSHVRVEWRIPEDIPGVGANHRQRESIYREWEPITGRERVFTGSGSQSQAPKRGPSHLNLNSRMRLLFAQEEWETGGRRVH